MGINTDALEGNFRRLGQTLRTINKDKTMYKVKTTLLNDHKKGSEISDSRRARLIQDGCPKDWFEKVEPEFEVGDWVFRMRDEHFGMTKGDIARITGEEDKMGCVPLGGYDGEHSLKKFRPATPVEIKDHLIEEAGRRGLERGERVSSLETGRHNLSGLDQHHNETGCNVSESSKIGPTIEYDAEKDILWACGWGVVIIYKQGNWAEPIDTTPNIEINGYKAEFHDDYVQFGCAKIDKKFFTEMYIHDNDAWDYTGEGNRSVTGIRWGDGIFTTEDIKQIAKYYQ